MQNQHNIEDMQKHAGVRTLLALAEALMDRCIQSSRGAQVKGQMVVCQSGVEAR